MGETSQPTVGICITFCQTCNSVAVPCAVTAKGASMLKCNVRAVCLVCVPSVSICLRVVEQWAFWDLSGNSRTGCNTSPCLYFLGTPDFSSFEIRVNNERAYRIEPVISSSFGGVFAPNIIGGFSGNYVFGKAGGATIAGGGYELNPNSVTADFGTVGGGYGNRAGPPAGSPLGPYPWPTVGGGNGNTASNDGSTVGGGVENTASGEISTVGGGGTNIPHGRESTPGGGYCKHTR